MGFGDIAFVGLAILYGTLASLGLVGALKLCAHPRPWHFFPVLCLTLSFLFLTQHPFPVPGSLNCPVSTAVPQLHLFHFTQTIGKLGQRDATMLAYLSNRTLVASAMNFLICVAIGWALVRHMQAWPRILLFGVTLSGAIELTQLTGIWGVYPCAYRQFNVDDLMLNILGVFCGAALRRWRLRAGTP